MEALHDCIAKFSGKANAVRVLDRFMEVVDGLAQFPERGSHPQELLALGIKDYRQMQVVHPGALLAPVARPHRM